MELSKTFDSKAAEERWFQLWIDRGYFTADPDKPGEAFSIVIPPPNVTGQLHLGHALNVTLQDIIVRTRRMQGFNTLWVPGTDHAGIATQNAVEKDLAKEGKNRHQLGRDKFEKKVWEWRETYGNRILNQLRRLGASCDWSRERFTLDEGLSRAVNEVFIRLYKQGLIYKDRRLINWCPRCETALSDLEVDHKDRQRHAVVHQVSARRRLRLYRGGDDASRDDARRHRGRGESRGRSLSRDGRQEGAVAAHRARDSDHRGFGGR